MPESGDPPNKKPSRVRLPSVARDGSSAATGPMYARNFPPPPGSRAAVDAANAPPASATPPRWHQPPQEQAFTPLWWRFAHARRQVPFDYVSLDEYSIRRRRPSLQAAADSTTTVLSSGDDGDDEGESLGGEQHDDGNVVSMSPSAVAALPSVREQSAEVAEGVGMSSTGSDDAGDESGSSSFDSVDESKLSPAERDKRWFKKTGSTPWW